MPVSCADLQFLAISHRISQSNLHIRCERFDTPQACAVANLVRHYHERCNHIFIDLREAGRPHPAAARCLRAAIRQTGAPPRQIVYKGAGGFDLALEGNRVIVFERPKHGKRCCGNCAQCSCRAGKAGAGHAERSFAEAA